jgi:hypothetical protein
VKRLVALLVAGIVLAASTPPAAAAVVTYTFEPSQFSLGQTTTLTGVSPNSGPSSFTASFVSVIGMSPPNTNFQIVSVATGGSPVHAPPFSGQFLAETATGGGDTLAVTFNTPVDTVDFDLATAGPAQFVLTIPERGGALAPILTSDPMDGGDFSAHVNIPTGALFQQLIFNVSNLAGDQGVQFSIDNLVANAPGLDNGTGTPEPATLAVFGVLAAGAFGVRRRSKAAPAA